MSDLSLRPRSATEIVDAAFRLYRQHFVPILTVSALVYIPAFIFSLIITHYTSGGGVDIPGALLGVLVAFIAAFLWYPTLWASLLAAASDAYLGREVDAGHAIRTALRRFGGVLVSTYARWFLFVVGLMLFVIPGLYIYARYFAVPSAVLFEDVGAAKAMSRSLRLSRGETGKILGAILLAVILFVALSLAATFGATALSGSSLDEPSMVVQIFSALVSIVSVPLVAIVEVLLYYDVRIRKEGYDIEVMTQQLAAAPSAAH